MNEEQIRRIIREEIKRALRWLESEASGRSFGDEAALTFEEIVRSTLYWMIKHESEEKR